MRSVDLGNIIRRGLIDVVIEPVGIEQLSGASPADNGGARGVIIREIVIRHVDGKPFIPIPEEIL